LPDRSANAASAQAKMAFAAVAPRRFEAVNPPVRLTLNAGSHGSILQPPAESQIPVTCGLRLSARCAAPRNPYEVVEHVQVADLVRRDPGERTLSHGGRANLTCRDPDQGEWEPEGDWGSWFVTDAHGIIVRHLRERMGGNLKHDVGNNLLCYGPAEPGVHDVVSDHVAGAVAQASLGGDRPVFGMGELRPFLRRSVLAELMS
jgi:hypothetical protein